MGARHRTHPGRAAGRWSAVVCACIVLGALAAAPAQAATGTIDGTPLNVYANDVGRLQVAFDGAASGEFYTGALVPTEAGLTAAVQLPSGGQFTIFGRGGTPFTAASAPIPSGDGSAGNPYRLTTAFNGGSFIQVTEVVQYVNGSNNVTVTYTVGPLQTPGIVVRLYASGDVLPASSYFATGFVLPGPPRRVGAQALGGGGVGGSGSLVEISPWSSFQEGNASTVDSVLSTANPSAAGFNNTVLQTATNNGAGVGAQWNIGALSQPVSVAVGWSFTRTSALNLAAAGPTVATGQTATVTVAARTNDGAPDAGRSVPYTITGANPSSGAVTTAADGTAAISWLGSKVGTDTLTAFADRDGNGIWDVNTEPRQITTITWTQGVTPPPAPPVPGKSVVVKVVSGKVFIKKPGSGRARQTGAPTKGFVPFTGAANIPVGSQLDTRKGRVALTSAADTGGVKTQSSNFYDGIFAVKQSVPKKKPAKPKALVTDLVMKGQISRSQCAPIKGARAAAESAKKKKGPKAVLGRLWGNGKGKFRTNGKYSSATVRGTIWLVEDRCEGTLTKVSRGTVQVRDFKRKKTVTVKAGHSYLARAQRASSKSKRR